LDTAVDTRAEPPVQRVTIDNGRALIVPGIGH